MKRFIITLFLSMWLGAPANAFTADTGKFTDFELVSETMIPGPGGGTMSLCYRTEDFRVFGYTLTSTVKGYVLSSDGCLAGADRPFTTAQVETAQSLNLLDSSIAPEATNSMERNLKNYGLWVAIGLALCAVIIRRVKSLMGFDLRAGMRKKAAERILTAMCYVGKCDGIVASNEIGLISNQASRLTRRNFQPADVIRITDHIDMNLSLQDYIDFGRGLRDSEKDVMMRGAFYVALSNGRILPSEYEFISELAHGIGMPGTDFRRVMNLALNDLDLYPPARR